MVLSAIKAKRQIFVEKPICLRREELKQIDEAYDGRIAPRFRLASTGVSRRRARKSSSCSLERLVRFQFPIV